MRRGPARTSQDWPGCSVRRPRVLQLLALAADLRCGSDSTTRELSPIFVSCEFLELLRFQNFGFMIYSILFYQSAYLHVGLFGSQFSLCFIAHFGSQEQFGQRQTTDGKQLDNLFMHLHIMILTTALAHSEHTQTQTDGQDDTFFSLFLPLLFLNQGDFISFKPISRLNLFCKWRDKSTKHKDILSKKQA